MTRDEIVAEIAKERRVEQMCKNIAHSATLSQDLQDLSQMVYGIILDYKSEVIEDLWRNGELNFFLVRIIKTQMWSPRSTYNYTFHHHKGKIDADIADIAEVYGKRAE